MEMSGSSFPDPAEISGSVGNFRIPWISSDPTDIFGLSGDLPNTTSPGPNFTDTADFRWIRKNRIRTFPLDPKIQLSPLSPKASVGSENIEWFWKFPIDPELSAGSEKKLDPDICVGYGRFSRLRQVQKYLWFQKILNGSGNFQWILKFPLDPENWTWHFC